MNGTRQTTDNVNRSFSNFASYASGVVGSSYAFLFALMTIAAWLITGPMYHFSNGWQLVINSWTNIATFIVVFVIQNSQNRDSRAINLKLDELIRSLEHARDDMINIEQLSDKELQELAQRYERIRREWEGRRAGIDSRRDPAA
jgi:low affinity Fe/Cu permease